MKIGFIGTGVMGQSMVRRLIEAGHELQIFSRTKSKAEPLIEKGAQWMETPTKAAQNADLVMTMVGYPADVKEIYLGENGVLQSAQKGTVFVDFTTSEPALAKNIYLKGKELGLSVLDAPVSGGDIGAQNGTLSIMVGGDQRTFEQLSDVWPVLGKTYLLQGSAGSGQHTKMVNQILIATNMIGVCEAIIYGVKAGLNMDEVMKSVSTGAAASWSLSNLGTRILKEDFKPGFFVEHFVKDMGIALKEAGMMKLELPGLKMATELYDGLVEMKHERSGTQALYLYLRTFGENA